jgi:hypothetical protein
MNSANKTNRRFVGKTLLPPTKRGGVERTRLQLLTDVGVEGLGRKVFDPIAIELITRQLKPWLIRKDSLLKECLGH